MRHSFAHGEELRLKEWLPTFRRDRWPEDFVH
jgi:hypothetical protein